MSYMLFSGNATPKLAGNIARCLGVSLGKIKVDRFNDGEVSVTVDSNVRGMDVYIIQSTCKPTNDSLMELLLMADALRRASAQRITAVVPYLGYGRQDRRPQSARVPISAKVIADMMKAVHIERLLTVDLHADQIQGFFDCPVDNVYSSRVLIADVLARGYKNPIVVSPDVGGVVRARAIAKRINGADLAIIDKRREAANESEVMNIIGEVNGRSVIIVDDIVDTAGTIVQAAEALKANGADRVAAYITHPVLSGNAVDKIQHSSLCELVVSDTIPLAPEARKCTLIRQLSLDALLSEAIRRVSNEESLSAMFEDESNYQLFV